MLSRALKDAEVWKERALVALKELRAIKAEICTSKKNEGEDENAS
jgi:hypothetical protein